MRPMRSLLIYLAIVFTGGALLAPWLYFAAQWSAPFSPMFAKLAAHPFHRFVHRALLIFALAGLWPLLRSSGLKSVQEVGLGNLRVEGKPFSFFSMLDEWGKHFDKKFFWGITIGFASLASIGILAVAFGARSTILHTSAELRKHLLNATLAALAVAFVEELVFRGAVFGAVRKTHGWRIGIVVSSSIYALVHFFGRSASPATIQWTSGFQILGGMMAGFFDYQQLVPGFFNLLIAGAILALAYQKYGTLYYSIGLHAGWIFWLKSYKFFTAPIETANPWFWGSNKLIDGWLGGIVLLPVFIFFYRLNARKKSPEAKCKLSDLLKSIWMRG